MATIRVALRSCLPARQDGPQKFLQLFDKTESYVTLFLVAVSGRGGAEPVDGKAAGTRFARNLGGEWGQEEKFFGFSLVTH
jgi:hypothetical protein